MSFSLRITHEMERVGSTPNSSTSSSIHNQWLPPSTLRCVSKDLVLAYPYPRHGGSRLRLIKVQKSSVLTPRSGNKRKDKLCTWTPILFQSETEPPQHGVFK